MRELEGEWIMKKEIRMISKDGTISKFPGYTSSKGVKGGKNEGEEKWMRKDRRRTEDVRKEGILYNEASKKMGIQTPSLRFDAAFDNEVEEKGIERKKKREGGERRERREKIESKFFEVCYAGRNKGCGEVRGGEGGSGRSMDVLHGGVVVGAVWFRGGVVDIGFGVSRRLWKEKDLESGGESGGRGEGVREVLELLEWRGGWERGGEVDKEWVVDRCGYERGRVESERVEMWVKGGVKIVGRVGGSDLERSSVGLWKKVEDGKVEGSTDVCRVGRVSVRVNWDEGYGYVDCRGRVNEWGLGWRTRLYELREAAERLRRDRRVRAVRSEFNGVWGETLVLRVVECVIGCGGVGRDVGGVGSVTRKIGRCGKSWG
ncbi:hypothetical protein Tco_0580837 [Tanacetum coccineum]